MTTQEKINKLEEILELEANTLYANTELSSLDEWDSVAILSIIVMLEDDFDVKVKGNDIKACKSVADVIALIP